MDWKYKHFKQQAVFKALPREVREAARAVVAESLGAIEETPDGFQAKGYSGLHLLSANVHITSVAEGTQVAVELLARRASNRGFMLWDVGGYFNGLIDKWFTRIAQRLGGDGQQALVSATTSGTRVGRALLAGCATYLVVGTCLTVVASVLDAALVPNWAGSLQGPLVAVVSVAGLLAGVAAFLYVTNPDSPAARSFRERLLRNRNAGKK